MSRGNQGYLPTIVKCSLRMGLEGHWSRCWPGRQGGTRLPLSTCHRHLHLQADRRILHCRSSEGVDFLLQHFRVNLQLEIHKKTERDLQPAKLDFADTANLGEASMGPAQVFKRLHRYSQACQKQS